MSDRRGSRRYGDSILTLAGWTADRDVSNLLAGWESELLEKGGFVMHEPARSFLREFGGLAWPTRDVGEHLSRYSFNLDPASAVYESDRFVQASQAVGEALYPVGEAINGHCFLAAGESGRFYLVMDDVEDCGSNPWEAFGQLLP